MAGKKQASKNDVTRDRPDGRKAMLLYLDPELIRELKKEALDRDLHVYELVEDELKRSRSRSSSV